MTIREFVGFIPFSIMSLTDAIQTVLDEARRVAETNQTSGVAMHFCNAYNVALARSDPEYRGLINQGDYIFSDGVPITWVGKRVRPDMSHDWERVYGPDVMQGVFAQSTQQQPRHYLVGGSPEVLEALQRSLAQRYPEAHVVGAESPPFRPATADELRERDSRIADSGATIVWVGLGTPRHDYEASRLARHLPVAAIGVGAAFDFLSGTKPQAPLWMQKSGTEWLFRLVSEPRRLTKRYVWGNSVFILEAARTLRSKH